MEGKQAPRRTSSGGGNSRQSGEELRQQRAADERQVHKEDQGQQAAGSNAARRQQEQDADHAKEVSQRHTGSIVAGMATRTQQRSEADGKRHNRRWADMGESNEKVRQTAAWT